NQLGHLAKKQQLTYWRNPQYNFMRMFLFPLFAVIFGTTFYQLSAASVKKINSHIGLIYNSMDFIGVINLMTVLEVTCAERAVFYRERMSNYYGPLPYSLSLWFAEIPYLIIVIILFVTIEYWLVGWSDNGGDFIFFMFVFYLYTSACTYVGQWMSALMPNEKVANVAVGALSCLFNLFSGFLLPRTAMKPGYKWFQYVMPSYYSLSALAGIQFGDNQDILTVTTKGVASNMTVAAFVKKTYDFHPERKYDFMVGLIVVWLVLQLAIYLTFNPADLETHRLKNRECMRKARQRRRKELQEMQTTVLALEKQYAELSQRSAQAAQNNDPAVPQMCQDRKFAEAVAGAKRLGAENLYLQTLLKQNIIWEHQVQRVVDYDASDIVCATSTQSHTWQLTLDVLDEAQAEKELGFHRLTDCEFTRIILDNKRDTRNVETRLLQRDNSTRIRRMQAFGWEIVQRIEGGVMEFVFTKKFSDLKVHEILQTKLSTDMEHERSRKIKAETRRLQVIQRMGPNAFVFVHDVSSTGDIAVFRSVVARFLIEDTRDFPLNGSDLEDKSGLVKGTGYILGTNSVNTDKAQHLSEEALAGKLAWADVALSVTGETCQRKLTAAEQEAPRVKNRVGTRKIRQRQRQELLEMKTTVVELDKEYAERCSQAEAAGKDTELLAALQMDESDDPGHPDLVVLAKQLGAEKLLLRTILKQKAVWTLQIQRILDFEASSLAAAQKIEGNVIAQLDTVDEVQAEEELEFHPLTEWDLTRTILHNKRNIHHVENRLNPPSGLSVAVDHPSDSIEQDETGRTMAWADLALTSEAYDVEDPMTGEQYQQVV
ncbi:hypothetical protein JG688_00006420, partial [Phytophthora aleatoria]